MSLHLVAACRVSFHGSTYGRLLRRGGFAIVDDENESSSIRTTTYQYPGSSRMFKPWQLLYSTARSTRHVLILSARLSSPSDSKYVIMSCSLLFVCLPVSVFPEHGVGRAMALSSLGQARHKPYCFCSHPFRAVFIGYLGVSL